VATIVVFHAHPDDEVLLTGGTIAKLAAERHRVIVAVACDGDMWDGLGKRLDEFRASVAILGADKAVHLGYADSGHGPVLFDDPPGRTRFVRADVEGAAGKLAALLTDEHADLLLSYDPQGCNGHRDHVRVHQVGARAAELAGVRVVEATVPRELIARFAQLRGPPGRRDTIRRPGARSHFSQQESSFPASAPAGSVRLRRETSWHGDAHWRPLCVPAVQ
jgi:LmbE family N-acetylglucosaminyl deacetylase